MADKSRLSLTNVARLQFDRAAIRWWGALGIELLAGLGATGVAICQPSGDWAILLAGISAALLGASYVVRLRSEAMYDDAETMRRQSVLTEGLGWKLDGADIVDWLHRAGKRAQLAVRSTVKEDQYFSSTAPVSAKRLAEMTFESAFYTRLTYAKLRAVLLRLLLLTAAILAITVIFALTRAVPETVDAFIAIAVLTFIPTLLSLDIIGWVSRLGRLVNDIRAIEGSLSRALSSAEPETTRVLRMVAEYNCQVIQGIPIPRFLFSRWHGEIAELWDHRKAQG
jgi:hypothetical protein